MRHKLPLYDVFRQRLSARPAPAEAAAAELARSIRVFDHGKRAFAEILDRIARAQRSIEVRAFLWRDDEVGNRLGRALLDAAERGVEVTIHKDRIAAVYEYAAGTKQSFFHKRIHPTQRLQAWILGAVFQSEGSFKQRPNPLAQAILDHPRIAVHHKRKRFDHSKLFVFDEDTVTLGSMGIGDNHYSDWLDVMVEIGGAEHVDRLRRRIAGEVAFDPGRDVDFLVHNRRAARRGHCSMLAERLALIEAAERRVTVEMAYMGDRRFTAAMLRAIKRGVQVTLVTAARADVLGNLNRATCDILMRRTGTPDNLTIVFLPRMVHAKIVVVDDLICDIGSANFTPLSHGVYDEINTYIADPVVARMVQEVIAGHCEEGEEVTGRVGYRRWRSHLERVVMAYQSRRGGRLRRVRRRRRRRVPLLLGPGRATASGVDDEALAQTAEMAEVRATGRRGLWRRRERTVRARRRFALLRRRDRNTAQRAPSSADYAAPTRARARTGQPRRRFPPLRWFPRDPTARAERIERRRQRQQERKKRARARRRKDTNPDRTPP
ncbi:MAG: phosphatidylserine/phosphatidylglycerophosphate/cardiolipin synthase family protein [Myxococcota bacterium]